LFDAVEENRLLDILERVVSVAVGGALLEEPVDRIGRHWWEGDDWPRRSVDVLYGTTSKLTSR
jgi:hypothetical protein